MSVAVAAVTISAITQLVPVRTPVPVAHEYVVCAVAAVDVPVGPTTSAVNSVVPPSVGRADEVKVIETTGVRLLTPTVMLLETAAR